MPTPKQMEKLASDRLGTSQSNDPAPDGPLPKDYWDAVLRDPRAAGKPWLPVQQMRMSEIPRELLRVECARCSRCVEIQRLDAIRLYGRMRSGVTSAKLCSTTAARFGQGATKRTAVGRVGPIKPNRSSHE
jgi:hypothetical protein